MLFLAANLLAIGVFPRWETVPFHLIWVSLTLLYGYRVWGVRRTGLVLLAVFVTTGVLLWRDILRGWQPPDELTEVPLMSAMFVAMVWHARRRSAAMRQLEDVSQTNLRLLEHQRAFVAAASHELRTPITVALGEAELLAADLTGTAPEADARLVVDELNRLRRLADRLLALATAEDSDFLCRTPVEVDTLVVDAVRRWTPTERRWLVGRLDEVVVDGDADRLLLALDALIENAVKSTKAGDTIELGVELRDGAACITVADTGYGIPTQDQVRIFDRFARIHSGADDPDESHDTGTGLGLSIVKAVTEAHGGQVSVDSQPGQGSVFRVLLPARPTTPTAARDGSKHVEAAGAGG